MSKLEELIKEFCPNGVIRVTIGKICKISRGIVMSKDFIRDNHGDYPVYSSQTENNGCLGYINTYKYDGEYVTWTTDGANAGTVFYRSGKFSITNVCGLLEVKDLMVVNTKYLYYALSIEARRYVNQGMGNPKLMSNIMASVQIPLPALPVQREIVRVLDSFTLYSAELTAELTARRKQYEFYRDKLLNFTCNIIQTNIGQVCNVFTGGEPPVEHIKGDVPTGEYKYPIWGNGKDIYGYSKTFQIGQDAVVISSIGANTGAVYFRKANFTPIIRLKVLTPKNNDINIRYLFYYLSNKKIESKSSSVPNMNSNEIKQLSIEIPPMDVQERIVKVLDNFDAICSDLGIGLPAEIEKRQKQYEYYRDKLLSFQN